MEATVTAWAPRALSILRIMSALTFMSHGTQKLWNFPIAGPGELPTLLLVAAWLEVAGGLLLVIGLFTRPVAFILSGMMAVAFFMAHVPKGGLYPSANGGEPAYLFCFIFLYLAFAGGGAWSADAARRRG
jgi:putative oxidoreductase